MYLNQHIKKVHEKTPCVHCGQLISLSYMNRHIQAQHTTDNEKDHKCDVCNNCQTFQVLYLATFAFTIRI